ncbi:uncharacterized protein K441DRAFT_652112 [Cenococcum geophilum 1.58]|uniref:uncharacterized protein n=1 Tax=Cenococcum geophilum 1.58 TaxID=794803 RepID=UPI00358E43F8|nr:hypothetical protein K441DRAFT_652112 [Cenococcum geophilum 1.58]
MIRSRALARANHARTTDQHRPATALPPTCFRPRRKPSDLTNLHEAPRNPPSPLQITSEACHILTKPLFFLSPNHTTAPQTATFCSSPRHQPAAGTSFALFKATPLFS